MSVITNTLPSVSAAEGVVVVRYISAMDGSACEVAIRLADIVQVTLENSGGAIHWFLQHRDGWTIHFNDRFNGAAIVATGLQSQLQFVLPREEDIAGAGGRGIVAWPAGSC